MSGLGSSFDEFPFAWQVPNKTELVVYEGLANHCQRSLEYYFPFPWASLIDSEDAYKAGRLFSPKLRSHTLRATVSQHIKTLEYMDCMRLAGITDVFWPHATTQTWRVNGIRIHSLPLFPVVTPPNLSVTCLMSQRSYLYSFIGAYNKHDYNQSGRAAILELQSDNRAFIEITNEWHFNKEVYLSQVHGVDLPAIDIETLRQREENYCKIMADSTFCLCPRGTGPNSIRLWEAIANLTIPVIISDGLRLPGKIDEWTNSVVQIPNSKESIQALPSLLRHLEGDTIKLREMHAGLARIREKYIIGGIHYEVASLVERPLSFLLSYHIEMLVNAHSIDRRRINIAWVKTPLELRRQFKNKIPEACDHRIFILEDYSEFILLHHRWFQSIHELSEAESNLSFSIVSCSPHLEKVRIRI